MNLLNDMYEKLETDFKDKDTISKIYFIYESLCELFQYDSRWHWAIGEERLQDEIFNKEIDITNVTSNKVVCSSFSKMFCELADLLLSNDENYDMSLLQGELAHCFAITYLKDNTVIEIDPLGNTNDFLNIKKGLPIQGIKIISLYDDPIYLEERALRESEYRNDALYLQFLKKIGEEMREQEAYKLDPTLTLFDWFRTTTNFHSMGLNEANGLFLLTVSNIAQTSAQNLMFRIMFLYDPVADDVKLIYKVPSTTEEDSHYCMRLEQGNIEIQKIEEPITDYIARYRSFTDDREKYLSKK